MRPSYSGTRFAGWYFTAQAILIGGWWLLLLSSPGTRDAFIPPGAGEADLLAFLGADLLFAAPASLMCGIAFFRDSRWALPLGWATAGAVTYVLLYCLGWSILRQGAWLNVALMAPAALLTTAAALDQSAGTVPIFRQASPGPPARHVAATLGQIVAFWGFFLLVLPAAVHWVERQLGMPGFDFPARRPLALAAFLAFSVLGLSSGVVIASRGDGTPLPFMAPNRLVVTGPYRYLRNPMVVAGLGQGLCVALWLGSWAVVAYVLAGGLVWQLLVRPAEERDLLERFGGDYAAYRGRVRCWIPLARPAPEPIQPSDRQADPETWDRQIERDLRAGRLDPLIDEARGEHRSGRTRPL